MCRPKKTQTNIVYMQPVAQGTELYMQPNSNMTRETPFNNNMNNNMNNSPNMNNNYNLGNPQIINPTNMQK